MAHVYKTSSGDIDQLVPLLEGVCGDIFAVSDKSNVDILPGELAWRKSPCL